MIILVIDSLVLLGYINKLINVKRKEFYRLDLGREYYYLNLFFLFFLEFLYGDDVVKLVKEI